MVVGDSLFTAILQIKTCTELNGLISCDSRPRSPPLSNYTYFSSSLMSFESCRCLNQGASTYSVQQIMEPRSVESRCLGLRQICRKLGAWTLQCVLRLFENWLLNILRAHQPLNTGSKWMRINNCYPISKSYLLYQVDSLGSAPITVRQVFPGSEQKYLEQEAVIARPRKKIFNSKLNSK